MATKSNLYGVNLYHSRTRKSRKGRHAKKPNKSNDRKEYKGQGRI
jgi:hypothetical protein